MIGRNGRSLAMRFGALLIGLLIAGCGGSDSAETVSDDAPDGGPAVVINGGAGNGNASGSTDAGCFDEDSDGVSTCNADCNDNDDEMFPGNPAGDVCGDNKDNDCDGDADPLLLCCIDNDDDGVNACSGDCNDSDPDMFPGNPVGDVCGDNKDNDCDGDADPPAVCCLDEDNDTVTTCDDDCDDGDDTIFPGNAEVCGDAKDNDCDGEADQAAVCCLDADDDTVTTCDNDCDDGDDTIFPGNAEVCGDAKDNDCDGEADPDSLCCFDDDSDGVTTCDGDCDDGDATVFPGNPLEVCGDGVDNDCGVDPDPTAVCNPGSGAIGTYVSELIGVDPPTGTGLQNAPVRTIAQGMANAVTLANGQPVFVAEGDYAEKVNMVDGVSLLGGHQCDGTSCTWARDPSMYVSTIVNTDMEGIIVSHNVFTPTRLDGFVIRGLSGNPGDGQVLTTIFIDQGTPIIDNCTLVGGTTTGGASRSTRGIHILGPANDPGGAVIQNSVLQAGDATANSSVISLDFGAGGQAEPAVAVITGNTIKGGAGSWTRAVTTWGAGVGTLIQNNDIFAGSVVGSGSSFALFISGTLTVDANRLNHDPFQVGVCAATSFWCGGIESEGSTSIITNNVIYGMIGPMSAAIYFGDGEVPFGEIVINGNTLNGVGLFAQNPNTSLSTALACRTSNGTNAIVGRIRNNILDAGQARNRFGMYEQNNTGDPLKTCVPEAYENNDIYFRSIFGATDNAHRQWLGGAASENMLPTVTEVNLQSYAAANFTDNCLLDSTWHLMSGSPCIDKGVAAEAPALDFEGDTRPLGAKVDVGADESQ